VRLSNHKHPVYAVKSIYFDDMFILTSEQVDFLFGLENSQYFKYVLESRAELCLPCLYAFFDEVGQVNGPKVWEIVEPLLREHNVRRYV